MAFAVRMTSFRLDRISEGHLNAPAHQTEQEHPKTTKEKLSTGKPPDDQPNEREDEREPKVTKEQIHHEEFSTLKSCRISKYYIPAQGDSLIFPASRLVCAKSSQVPLF